MAYIKKINGYVIKDEEAREAAAAAQQAAENAQTRADDAYALAEGRSSAIVYETFQDMVTALLNMDKNPDDINEGIYELDIGTNILLRELNVPDYWVSGHLDTKGTVTQFVPGQRTYDIGCYKINILETEKVDLSGYATTGSVNNIINGTTKVAKATTADSATTAGSATKATQDASGNVITSTYATKTELNAEKITLKYDTSDEELIIQKNGVTITPTTQT